MTIPAHQSATLAIDASSAQASVAIAIDDTCMAKQSWFSTRGNPGKLLREIDQLRKKMQTSWEQFNKILIGCGPGQYAGLRASMTVAQALQLPAKGKTYGIPSAYAVLAKRFGSEENGAGIIVCGDARRNHIWAYHWCPNLKPALPQMQCLTREDFSKLDVPADTRVVSADYDRLHGNVELPQGAHWKAENEFPDAEHLIQLATSYPEDVLQAPDIIYIHPPV